MVLSRIPSWTQLTHAKLLKQNPRAIKEFMLSKSDKTLEFINSRTNHLSVPAAKITRIKGQVTNYIVISWYPLLNAIDCQNSCPFDCRRVWKTILSPSFLVKYPSVGVLRLCLWCFSCQSMKSYLASMFLWSCVQLTLVGQQTLHCFLVFPRLPDAITIALFAW